MKKINNFSLWGIVIVITAIIAACIDPEGDVVNPFYDFKLDHAWGNWEVARAATCATEGLEVRTCEAHGALHSEERAIPKDLNAHNWEAAEDEDYIAPTCTEAGFGYRVCTLCAAETKGAIPLLGHEFEVYELTGAPTCTTYGRGFQVCTRCSINENSISSAPPLGHAFEVYEVTIAPTCTEAGIETAQCVRCTAENVQPLEPDPDAHDWGEETFTPANCVTRGVTQQACTLCAAIKEEFSNIDPDAHDWDGEYTLPTCVTPGYREQECTRCGIDAPNNGEFTALGHDYADYQITTPSTCMAQGIRTAYCVRRNIGCESFNPLPLAIDPNAHDWNEIWGEGSVYPTCTTGGSVRITCSYNAAHYNTRAVPAWGHEWSFQRLTDPNCTTAGSQRATCSRDPSHTDTQVIPALGHSYGNWAQTTAPTCTASGIDTRVCTRDSSHRDTRTGAAALGHWWIENWTVTKSATCTDKGTETRTCYRRSDATETRDAAALGHNYAWTTTKNATCTDKGARTGTCTRNSAHTAAEDIAALGHRYGSYVQTTAPTCTDKGINTSTCANDSSHKLVQTGAAALGHSWGVGFRVTAAATCASTGSQTRTCTRDSSHTETETIAIKPDAHDYGMPRETTAPTCTAAGVQTYTCNNDNSHKITQTGRGALGHNYGSAWIYSGVTATANGTRHHVCTRDSSHTSDPELAFATGTAGITYTYDYAQILGGYEQHADISSFDGVSAGADIYIPQCILGERLGSNRGTIRADEYVPVREINFTRSTKSFGSLTILATIIHCYSGYECNYFTSINVNGNNLYYSSEDGILYDKAKTRVIAVPQGKSGNVILPASVTYVNAYAFWNCYRLTGVTLPQGVTGIGDYAFADCNLSDISLGSTTSIGDYAFQGCVNLRTPLALFSVTSIGKGAFQDCTSLTSVVFSSVTTIGNYAFQGCTSLTNLAIPSVTSLGWHLLTNCTSLVRITLPYWRDVIFKRENGVSGAQVSDSLNVPTTSSQSAAVLGNFYSDAGTYVRDGIASVWRRQN